MTIETSSHADQLPHLVRELERRIDDAYAAFGDLAAALPRARVEMKLSAVVGQNVLRQFNDVGAALTEARGHSVTAHRLIDKLADALGFEVVATGDERPKPQDPQRFFSTGAATETVEG